jgi:outer membrane protein insertion porin family
MSGLVVGKKITVPGEMITKVVEKFWDQGIFDDVKVIASKIEGDKIWIEIHLKERPRLSSLQLKGLKKSEVEDLNEKLGIKSGSQVTDNVMNTIQFIVKNYFKEKGFINTAINFEQVKDSVFPNKVHLIVNIDKKEKVKILKIAFYGNESFTNKRLRKALKKTKQKDLNIFTGSKFIESKFKEDKKKLLDFFKKNGYRDYRYISDSIEVIDDKYIALHIKIHEGKKYYLRNIKWVGNTKYPSEYLDQLLMMKKGDVYDQVAFNKRLSMDEDAVQSLYLDNGYLFSNIDVVETPVGSDSIDLEMRITEGRQASINRIIITGNEKTNEHVIRRELRTRPGDLFSKSAIMRSVRDLNQLGFFNPEKIEPVPLPNVSDGTVDIQYKLEEKSSDQLEVSGGWGASMLVGTIGLRFNNFSARNLFKGKAWRPVPSGDGQSLSLRAQSNGSYYKAYSMTFTEPWFGGKKPNSFSFSLYYNVQNSSSTGYFDKNPDKSFKVSGASIGLGRRLRWPDDNFTLYNELSYQNYSLKNWYQGNFIFTDGVSQNLSFKTQFGRNTTDQPIYPRSGSNFSLSLQLTPPFSLFKKKNFWIKQYSPNEEGEFYNEARIANEKAGTTVTSKDQIIFNKQQEIKYKWVEYHKWNFKGTWYTRLYKDLVLSFNSQIGYLGFYSRNLGYSPFEGFVLGGDGFSGYSLYGKETIGLRGYENESLTASKLTKYYSGGQESQYYTKVSNLYQKVTMELRYPITLQPSATIYALAFLEGGNSWYDFEKYNPFAIKRSAGIGIRAFLPMFGLLGIDWGYGFDEVPGNPAANGSQFHFVIGQQF